MEARASLYVCSYVWREKLMARDLIVKRSDWKIHQPATHEDLREYVVAIITAIYLGVCLQAAHDETVVCKSVFNYNVRQQDGHIGSPIEQMHSLCDYVEIILYSVLATYIVGMIATTSSQISHYCRLDKH